MIVTCEACFTNFNLNDELIKPSGSKVRCSKCQKVFKVYPEAPSEPPPVLFDAPAGFKDFAELDFSELDQLLKEDNPGKSSDVFMNLQKDTIPDPFLSADDPFKSPARTEAAELPTEVGLPEFSLDIPEIGSHQDQIAPTDKAPELFETRSDDLLMDQSDETLESFFSKSDLDEAPDSLQAPLMEMDLDAVTVAPEEQPRELSLDDFEESLEMDFSDISLDASTDSDAAAEIKPDTIDSQIHADPKDRDEVIAEDAPIGFDDIEALDLSDIETLIVEKDSGRLPDEINDGIESFKRSSPDTAPLSSADAVSAELQEMEEPYLTFDELQLDLDESNSDVLLEKKESFQPQLSKIAELPVELMPKSETAAEKTQSDSEKPISADMRIEDDLEDSIPAPRKGISPAVLIGLIVALIAAVGYGGYMVLSSMGISIPFISQPAPPKKPDPGNLSIKAFDISSRFIDNANIGKLFVITGKVKNDYPTPRGAIQITGKLFTRDKALSKTEKVFCGNILSDTDLASADLTKIQQRLQNRSGDNGINIKVKPGDSIPFMVVFSSLPEQLDEFTTEVNSSVQP